MNELCKPIGNFSCYYSCLKFSTQENIANYKKNHQKHICKFYSIVECSFTELHNENTNLSRYRHIKLLINYKTEIIIELNPYIYTLLISPHRTSKMVLSRLRLFFIKSAI